MTTASFRSASARKTVWSSAASDDLPRLPTSAALQVLERDPLVSAFDRDAVRGRLRCADSSTGQRSRADGSAYPRMMGRFGPDSHLFGPASLDSAVQDCQRQDR